MTGRRRRPGRPGKARPVLLDHLGIVLVSQPAQEKVCSYDYDHSLPRMSLFPPLDVICLNADIPPAKVHAACSDVGHILIII